LRGDLGISTGSEASGDTVIGHDVVGSNLLDEGAHLSVKFAGLGGADEGSLADGDGGELRGSHEAGLLLDDGVDVEVLDGPELLGVNNPFAALFPVVVGFSVLIQGTGGRVKNGTVGLSVEIMLFLVVGVFVEHDNVEIA